MFVVASSIFNISPCFCAAIFCCCVLCCAISCLFYLQHLFCALPDHILCSVIGHIYLTLNIYSQTLNWTIFGQNVIRQYKCLVLEPQLGDVKSRCTLVYLLMSYSETKSIYLWPEMNIYSQSPSFSSAGLSWLYSHSCAYKLLHQKYKLLRQQHKLLHQQDKLRHHTAMIAR